MILILKQDILGIPKGTKADGYGYWEEPDTHLFSFINESGEKHKVHYIEWGTQVHVEPQSLFTVTEKFAREHPELFEIVED